MARSAPKPPTGKTTRLVEAKRVSFATTHWSVVLAAAQGDLAHSAAALEKLCQRYWYPIYAFIRRRGSDRHEAEDLTQAFFAHLLEQETLKRVDPRKGRFRSFLLASLRNFLANDWDRRRTWKRGGRTQIISLDEAVAEEFYRREPITGTSPEKLFDRRWAAVLVEEVMTRLKAEYLKENKAELFARLEPGLTGELTSGWLSGVGKSLGMTEGAVRVALHRLRRRFGQLLRREIAQTVTSAADVDEEIHELFSAITV